MPRRLPLIVAVSAFALAGTVTAKTIVVQAGTLFDGVTASPQHEMSILIENDKITGIRAVI